MRCSPRWRISTTRTSPSGSLQWAQASSESVMPLGSSISPGSQCGPWTFQGNTCSSRQKTAFRAPGTSCARQPSSRSTALPHHEQVSVDSAPMPDPLRIIVLEGDETGQELLEQSLRVLDPAVLKVPVELEHYDLSLENRRSTNNEVVAKAAEAMREARFGLKAATVTPEGKDDVGSPNRLLREAIDGKVIIRTGRRIPGVTPVAGVHYPIAIVRMAVGDAYGAEEGREEKDGDEASDRHPDVPYNPVLIDATYAGLISGGADAPLVIPALNRDGDCLSDLVMPMFGSIAGAESVLLAFDENYDPRAVMAEAPHGTAPALQGKDIANPMAMILAAAALLHYAGELGHAGCDTASRAVYESVLEAVATGVATPGPRGGAPPSGVTSGGVSRGGPE